MTSFEVSEINQMKLSF